MNLTNECTTKELKLLEEIGLKIEDKMYNREELRQCETYIEDYIMSHSMKNQDIGVLTNKYNDILVKIVNFIK